MESNAQEQYVNVPRKLVRVGLSALTLLTTSNNMRVRSVTLPLQTTGNNLRCGSNGPRLLHEITLTISKTVRTSVKRPLHKGMLPEVLGNSGVPPILATRRPLITNHSSSLNDGVGNNPKRPEETTKFRSKSPQPCQGPNVSRFAVDTFIDLLPGRPARARY